MSETPTPPPRIRIRWGWFLACIVLGLTAIAVGLFVAPESDRAAYLATVISGVGTTLLLIGIVVLLERRIIDSAVKVVWDAAEEARAKTSEEIRAQVREFEDRVAAEWATATPETIAEKVAEMNRMTDEFVKEQVSKSIGEEGTGEGTAS